MLSEFIGLVGNRPRIVSKEAKYFVHFEQDEYVFGIHYQAADDETWYFTSDEHYLCAKARPEQMVSQAWALACRGFKLMPNSLVF